MSVKHIIKCQEQMEALLMKSYKAVIEDFSNGSSQRHNGDKTSLKLLVTEIDSHCSRIQVFYMMQKVHFCLLAFQKYLHVTYYNLHDCFYFYKRI